MPLSDIYLGFDVCVSQCQGFIFKETTGIYEPINNEHGWGSPNPDTGDVFSFVKLTIYPPNSNITPITIGNSGDGYLEAYGYPTTNPDNQLYISFDAIYNGNTPDDGLYTFVYEIEDADGNRTELTKQLLVDCKVDCCVKQMFIDAVSASDCSSCLDGLMKKALKAFTLLQGMRSAAACANEIAVNKILAKLQKICAGTNCGCS